MRSLRLILATALVCTVPLLGGCGENSILQNPSSVTTIPGVTTSVCSHTTVDEKGMYALEALYNVPAQAYVAADTHLKTDSHWLAVKPTVKPKLQAMYSYLKGARAAYEICDTATLGTYQAALQKLHDEVLPLIPHS